MKRRRILLALAIIGLLASCHRVAHAQSDFHNARFEQGDKLPKNQTLPPTERDPYFDNEFKLDRTEELQLLPSPAQQWSEGELPKSRQTDFKSLLKPRFSLAAEWQPSVEEVAISSYDFSAQMPMYPIFGPPPPFINAGYTLTQIDAPPSLDLPQNLHEFAVGMSWMRKINERWMARFMFNGVFASDLNNNTSDAWQIRAGGFAIYRPNDQWSFAFGALATGRDDIPVIPAIGAIWEPTNRLRINMMLPNPKIAWLLADSGTRQQWGYFGGGFSGGTWAYDRISGLPDRLTYRDWRLVIGWETTQPRTRGTFRPTGATFRAEVGYVFGREFEFDSSFPDISVDDSLLLRTNIEF